MKKILIAAAAWMVASAPAAATAAEPEMHLQSIETKLVYKGSGTLSNDMSAPSFTAWNTIIGEGDAAEPADDVIAFVLVQTLGEQAFKETPVTVVATNSKGREIARRSFDTVLTTEAGRASLPLFIPDSTCAGLVTITATMGTERMVKSVAMACGE